MNFPNENNLCFYSKKLDACSSLRVMQQGTQTIVKFRQNASTYYDLLRAFVSNWSVEFQTYSPIALIGIFQTIYKHIIILNHLPPSFENGIFHYPLSTPNSFWLCYRGHRPPRKGRQSCQFHRITFCVILLEKRSANLSLTAMHSCSSLSMSLLTASSLISSVKFHVILREIANLLLLFTL